MFGKNTWKEAIIDACVINFLSWDENDARKSLSNLINWEVKVALDPRVSEKPAALINAAKELLEWVPVCSPGSSGYIRTENLKKAIEAFS